MKRFSSHPSLRAPLPLRLLAVLAVLAALGACAPKKAPAPGPQQAPEAARPVYEAPAPQDAYGPVEPLPDFLRARLAEQYFAVETIYEPPPPGFVGRQMVQLTRESAAPVLGVGVVDYAPETASELGLAMSMAGGHIVIKSPWPCPGLAVPGEAAPDMLAWEATSPVLAAAEAAGKGGLVRLFDLNRCGQVDEQAFNSTVTSLAVSPRGAWWAATDQSHTLWLAQARPVPGKPAVAARLRYQTLALAFTPQEGVLMAADAAGFITLFATHSGEHMEHFRVEGAPFSAARFDGRAVHFDKADGSAVAYDLVERAATTPSREAERYVLTGGVLRYRTFRERLVKKVHLRPPELGVWVAEGALGGRGLAKVLDLDGRTRYYSLDDGLLAPPPENPAALGWKPEPLEDGYTFSAAGGDYALADHVIKLEHLRLYCRQVPGQGLFVWWETAVRPETANPHPGKLPLRESISADSPVYWQNMHHPQNLP